MLIGGLADDHQRTHLVSLPPYLQMGCGRSRRARSLTARLGDDYPASQRHRCARNAYTALRALDAVRKSRAATGWGRRGMAMVATRRSS